ncbi:MULTISPECIES: hypothetical protein [Pseudovibrio]|uniref:hypothetical protein n=1 Tax=Stappiaceae TaxID=2821832 RepID=UPI0023671D8A|nr:MULTISPECIES: hypothetical protein [Pseudovibrio]MDD7910780.1 hypothetical protein [Pseudovibrio exalbescens]MDX5593512.1 hypothetical protein [Pseudovibrio sp. SPO723]
MGNFIVVVANDPSIIGAATETLGMSHKPRAEAVYSYKVHSEKGYAIYDPENGQWLPMESPPQMTTDMDQCIAFAGYGDGHEIGRPNASVPGPNLQPHHVASMLMDMGYRKNKVILSVCGEKAADTRFAHNLAEDLERRTSHHGTIYTPSAALSPGADPLVHYNFKGVEY